jgi:hypothetical protein
MKLRSGRIIIGTDDLTYEQKLSHVRKIIDDYIKTAYMNADTTDKRLSCIADIYVFCSGRLFKQVLPSYQIFQDMLITKSSDYQRDLKGMIDTQRLLPTNKAYIRLTQSMDNFLKSLPNV